MFPGCGSAWKKPLFNIICPYALDKLLSIFLWEQEKKKKRTLSHYTSWQDPNASQETRDQKHRERDCLFLESLQFCCLRHPTTRIYPSFGHLITESQDRDSINVIHHQNPPVCIMVTLWSALIFLKRIMNEKRFCQNHIHDQWSKTS